MLKRLSSSFSKLILSTSSSTTAQDTSVATTKDAEHPLTTSFKKTHPPLLPPVPFPAKKLAVKAATAEKSATESVAPEETSNEILGSSTHEDGDIH